MTEPGRTFAVASDEALVEMIARARSRPVVIAPALTKPVADAAPENLGDGAFLEVLKTIMLRRRVAREIIDSLFESGQAAPEIGTFLS
jgi:hypothetical protein